MKMLLQFSINSFLKETILGGL